MLEMRPGCECCDRDLPADAVGAYICTFECTFCADCTTTKLKGVCPNCGGELLPRPRRPTAKTTALRAIVCEVAAQYLFNVILTPNFNRPHRNHVHLDLTAGKRWFIVR